MHAELAGEAQIRPVERDEFGYALLEAMHTVDHPAARQIAIATTSWLIAMTAVFGRWLAWIGAVAVLVVVVAAALLSAAFAIPALLVWALAASIALWRGESKWWP